MGRLHVQGECPQHGHCCENLGSDISKELVALQQEEILTCFVSQESKAISIC